MVGWGDDRAAVGGGQEGEAEKELYPGRDRYGGFGFAARVSLRHVGKIFRPEASGPRAPGAYALSDVSVEIQTDDTAVFRAKLQGPAGAQVWVRAWLSSEAEGTLAETASPAMTVGDVAVLTVVLRDSRPIENACIRIESAPFKTRQVVIFPLPA